MYSLFAFISEKKITGDPKKLSNHIVQQKVRKNGCTVIFSIEHKMDYAQHVKFNMT